MNKLLRQGKAACLAFLGTYGMGYLLKLMNVARPYYTIIHLFVFITVFILLQWAKKEWDKTEDKKQRKRRGIYAGVISFLFSLSLIMGYQLQNRGMTECGFYGKGMILLRSVCVSIVFFPFFQFLFTKMEKIKTRVPAEKNVEKKQMIKIFAICAVVIFLCLIPVWLAYYPIVMSYDFHRQVNEAEKGFVWFNPYQPIAHTWVIWVFLQLGNFLGSLETGMACMAVFQILLYSLASAYACTFIYRIIKKTWPVVAACIFFGIFPLNTVMVVCTTKDVLFSILFMILFLILCERTFFAESRKKLILDVLLVLEGCLMMQFRNNAWYAVAVFAVFFVLLSSGKERLRILLLCVFLLAGGKGMQAGIKAAIGTQLKVPEIEMYSVPIQQYARVGYFHGKEMDEETKQLIESYVNEEAWDAYNPPISDSVKLILEADGFYNKPGKMLSDWLKVGMKYPNEFMDAFLELTRGYWFLDDVSWAEALGSGTEGRMGAIYTYNSSEIEDVGSIMHESKFPWLETKLEEIVSGNAFYDWPLLSIFFKSGLYSWGLFLISVMFLYLRQKKQFMVCLCPVFYFCTILLGPMVCIRYLSPIMWVLPILLAISFIRKAPET